MNCFEDFVNYISYIIGNEIQTTPEYSLKLNRRSTLKRKHDQLPSSHLDDIEQIINNKISTQNLLSHYLGPPKPDSPVESVGHNIGFSCINNYVNFCQFF